MKRGILTLIVIGMMTAPLLAGQEKSIGLTLAQIQAQRKNIIEETVAPSPQQSEAFWQTYWEYRGKVGVLNDRLVALIKEYADSYAALNDDQAEKMVKEFLDIDKERAKLKQEYIKIFEKILIPKQVVRWYQSEVKMDAVFLADAALSIPFDS